VRRHPPSLLEENAKCKTQNDSKNNPALTIVVIVDAHDGDFSNAAAAPVRSNMVQTVFTVGTHEM